MAINTIGDLALSHILRGRNAQVKSDVARLSLEVATGQVASVPDTVKGNFNTVSAIEQSLGQLDAYARSINEAAGFASAVQDTLESLRQSAQDLSNDLLSAGTSGQRALDLVTGDAAEQTFQTAVSRLNTGFGGRVLFSGAATHSAAMNDADNILSDLQSAINLASATTADEVKTVVDDWFSSGVTGSASFDGYVGSTEKLAPMRIGKNQSVSIDVSATDPALRDTLRGLALAALIDRPPLSGSTVEQAEMARMAGETLFEANSGLLQTQAEVGLAQETLEKAKSTNASDASAMNVALSEILSVDPYDRATYLQQAENQLELLYALTARTNKLSLMDYL